MSIFIKYNIGGIKLNILLSLLLSVSSNLDNIIFGVSCGTMKIKIPFRSAILISIITTIITAIFMCFGTALGEILKIKTADIIGGILLIIIGLYFLISEVFISKSEETVNDKMIGTKGKLLLALNLSFNNIPIAIAGGISDTSIVYTAIFSFILSTLFIYIGNLVGRKVKSKIISAVAATILIVLGILKCV